jgi:hypothetical protein
MTREQHLEESKLRALAYLDKGDVTNAIASMLSDLARHPETAHAGESLQVYGLWVAMRQDAYDAVRFIEGFH